jgi:hypothetical protein|tara:strand:- start:983 stop:1225 length:243 start_codon:yes stop_codon:yes gene_type:complete
MPFKSDKQRKYLYANKPEVARKFSSEEKASGGMLKRALANSVRLPDLAQLRSGGMIGNGTKLPGACMDSDTRSLKKFKDN